MTSVAQMFSISLYLGGLGHLILAAMAPQVPKQLRWREDLASLTPMNRKLFWTYGCYIAATNLAFGLYTFAMHDDLLAGVPAALAVAGFIGVYWLVRLGLDFVVLPYSDWPKGGSMFFAHLALAGLFACLTVTYLGLVVWHGVR